MDGLCSAFAESIETGEYDALLLIPMFILDFLCIHPFSDGNGRMSRLLTLLLFYRAGYIVGKYISLEKLIEGSKNTYYEVLRDCSDGWHDNKNDYAPFARYYLGILQKAYHEFEDRIEHLQRGKMSKPSRIKAVIDRKVGKITKKEIMEACPDISAVTVERTLAELVKAGHLVKIGGGRTTGYAIKIGRNIIHSSAISDATIYNKKGDYSQRIRVINPGETSLSPFVDGKLQDFLEARP
jgi:Fic family protein